MEADITSQAVGLASNTDFSIINLFIRADIIIKTVIIILIVSSIYSWAIIFEKIKPIILQSDFETIIIPYESQPFQNYLFKNIKKFISY